MVTAEVCAQMGTDISRLTLADCARILNFKDKRSARRWCINHKVAVLIDVGAKTPYVLKTEFEAARLHSMIPHLKSNYGADWIQALTALQVEDISVLLTMKQVTKKMTIPKPGYTVVGKNATRFHDELIAAISGKSNG